MALKRQSSTPPPPPPPPAPTKINLQCGGHNNFSHVEPPSLSGVLLKLTSAYSRKQQQNNNNNSKNSNTHFINIPSLFARHNQHWASSGMCQPPCSFGAESRHVWGVSTKKKKKKNSIQPCKTVLVVCLLFFSSFFFFFFFAPHLTHFCRNSDEGFFSVYISAWNRTFFTGPWYWTELF